MSPGKAPDHPLLAPGEPALLLGRNLRCDLQGTGVRVTNIEPGLCESEFSLVRFGGDQARYDATYAGAEPIQPQDIADTIFWVLNTPAHVNINRLELMPVSQSWAGFAIERGAK